MDIIDNIKLMNKLTPNEKIMKEYILDHLYDIVYMSKNTLQEKIYVSDSVIYRFCKKLNLSGYDELRINIAQSLLKNQKINKGDDIDFNFPFTKNDTLDKVCNNIASIYKKTVELTYQSLDFKELSKAIYYLNKSQTICLFMPNKSNEIALGFLERIKDFNKKVKVSASPYDWKVDAYNLTDRDVVIINSYAGSSSFIMLNILPTLQKKNIPIILIASTHNKDFFQYATCKLLVCDKEDPIEKLYSYSSNISIQYVFDILFSGLYQKNYEDNFQRRKYIYR